MILAGKLLTFHENSFFGLFAPARCCGTPRPDPTFLWSHFTRRCASSSRTVLNKKVPCMPPIVSRIRLNWPCQQFLIFWIGEPHVSVLNAARHPPNTGVKRPSSSITNFLAPHRPGNTPVIVVAFGVNVWKRNARASIAPSNCLIDHADMILFSIGVADQDESRVQFTQLSEAPGHKMLTPTCPLPRVLP